MEKLRFTTKKGANITLTHVTSRELIGDHNFAKACDEIDISINDVRQIFPPQLETHPVHGLCIRTHRTLIPVPIEYIDRVKDMIIRCQLRREAALDRAIKADQDYTRHYNKVLSAMDSEGGA